MKAKQVLDDEHGPRHLTPAGRSVFHDLCAVHHAGSGVRYQAREDWPVRSGHARSTGIAGRTQAEGETGDVTAQLPCEPRLT